MSRRYYLDSNVLIRMLTADDQRKSQESRQLLEKASQEGWKLELGLQHICEVIRVLSSKRLYALEAAMVADMLGPILLLPCIEARDKSQVILALADFAGKGGSLPGSGVDFEDCLTAALAIHDDCQVISYDRDFDGLVVSRVEPGELVGEAQGLGN
jgi:predicted nucleic acid-binding protein